MEVLLRIYLVVAVGTVAALGALSVTAPRQAPRDAWVHAVVVAVFAGLLPIRLRAARRGSTAPVRTVGLIASALFLADVVEAALPDFVPVWMRIEMVAVAGMMAAVVGLVIHERVRRP